MDDRRIIALFFQRSENAPEELLRQYNRLLQKVAFGIVRSYEDAEECVNDAVMDIWNSIPPQCPESLAAYACALVRNRSLDRYRYLTAQKRDAGRFAVVLDELSACIDASLEDICCEKALLTEALEAFLNSLKASDRRIFLQRYYLAEDLPDIAAKMQMSENAVSVRLHRMRKKLRVFLRERGVQV